MGIASKDTVLTGLKLHFYIQQGIFHVCNLDFRWKLFLQEVRLKKLACQGFVGIQMRRDGRTHRACTNIRSFSVLLKVVARIPVSHGSDNSGEGVRVPRVCITREKFIK